jgi:endonuclease YncB( thermonuclease family)
MRGPKKYKYIVALVALLVVLGTSIQKTQAWSWHSQQNRISGKVINIHDGDTLTILNPENQQMRVRLAEIDAPEIGRGKDNPGQPFGRQAQRYLEEMCPKGSIAEVETQGRDQYGRVVGRVWCGGRDANKMMVQAGLAWVYDAYVKDRSLYQDQAAAQDKRIGLWSEKNPMPPWVWRKAQKEHRDEERENRRPY